MGSESAEPNPQVYARDAALPLLKLPIKISKVWRVYVISLDAFHSFLFVYMYMDPILFYRCLSTLEMQTQM